MWVRSSGLRRSYCMDCSRGWEGRRRRGFHDERFRDYSVMIRVSGKDALTGVVNKRFHDVTLYKRHDSNEGNNSAVRQRYWSGAEAVAVRCGTEPCGGSASSLWTVVDDSSDTVRVTACEGRVLRDDVVERLYAMVTRTLPQVGCCAQ